MQLTAGQANPVSNFLKTKNISFNDFTLRFEVRRRAKMPELKNVTFEQVIDERRMELVCEWEKTKKQIAENTHSQTNNYE